MRQKHYIYTGSQVLCSFGVSRWYRVQVDAVPAAGAVVHDQVRVAPGDEAVPELVEPADVAVLRHAGAHPARRVTGLGRQGR